MQATANIFVEYLKSPDKHIYIWNTNLRIISCILNKYLIITTEKFIYCSYCIEEAVVIFQNGGLWNEYAIYKKFVHAINSHQKGMESVFIIIKYHNIEIINWYYPKLIIRRIIFVQIMQFTYIQFCGINSFININSHYLHEHQSFCSRCLIFFNILDGWIFNKLKCVRNIKYSIVTK
jgi:hypothetical protein